MATPGSTCWKEAHASHTPLTIISTSTAPMSSRTAPASCARWTSASSTLDQLCVGGADLVVGQPGVGEGVEQRPVDLLAPDRLIDQVEQRRPGIRRLERGVAAGDRLVHPLHHDRRDQVLLGGEVAKQRSAADARLLGDLADADVEPALTEHLGGGIDQAPAVSLGVGPQASGLFLHGGNQFSYF